ncbi:hypothetical protein GCM10009630_65660 [Kribbella jejuensis]|uniref:Uncharacterized protein n=1 Tax=Kribbella jejuensis TaxID=236068 RepID=A0A542EP65_9ACTN|nr:hypothetical protein [Kribbella jejuensis]TQJ17137.1 hypothetical protein FB475_1249 [Kribbella jejuensis]
MAITWAPSADKHGIDHEDALQAIMNAYYVEREFDEPRPPATVRPTLFIRTPPRDLHIFHVMVARPKHLERLEEDK